MQRRIPLDGESFDLIVLGGGITGAGVALDAVLRGCRVAVIDKGDFASGTSSISSKLVHGGLRYLEQGQLGLVYEALHERRRLLENAPHLVRPLRFLIPFYRGSRVPAWKWRAGLFLYDLLAGGGNLRASRAHPRCWVRQHFPALRPDALVGGAEYADAQMDDARLVIEILGTAARRGVVVSNYVEAVGIEHGRTIRALDHLTGREVRFRGEVILNATGPWSDSVRRLAGEDAQPLLAPTKGVHLIARDQGLTTAFLLLHPRDGRVFFVLPWQGKTILGTTDTDCADSPDALVVTAEDISYLLEGYNHHVRPGIESSDLLGHFVGLRPLARSRAGEPSTRSREWRLVWGLTGLLSVLGGKYTTYRHMAEKIVDEVMRRLGRRGPCRTRAFRLDGTPEMPWETFEPIAVTTLGHRFRLDEKVARHLVRRYGRRVGEVTAYLAADPSLGKPIIEGEPDLRAEFAFHRDHEMACRPEDYLLRRTRLGMFHAPLLSRPVESFL
jgi:glycerol-3-phosphate dehydrogenase